MYIGAPSSPSTDESACCCQVCIWKTLPVVFVLILMLVPYRSSYSIANIKGIVVFVTHPIQNSYRYDTKRTQPVTMKMTQDRPCARERYHEGIVALQLLSTLAFGGERARHRFSPPVFWRHQRHLLGWPTGAPCLCWHWAW